MVYIIAPPTTMHELFFLVIMCSQYICLRPLSSCCWLVSKQGDMKAAGARDVTVTSRLSVSSSSCCSQTVTRAAVGMLSSRFTHIVHARQHTVLLMTDALNELFLLVISFRKAVILPLQRMIPTA